jgi:TRAP-type C4-dicarboxylate transport system permease small subunit
MATVGIPEAVMYLSIPLSGVAIVLFSLEHVFAILLGQRVTSDAFRGGSE